MGGKIIVRLDDETDRWNWVCRRGHRSWEPANRRFRRHRCVRASDAAAEPEFDELHDTKTGETVHRDDLVLEFPGAVQEGPA